VYFSDRKYFEVTENNSSGGYSFFVVFIENFCDLTDYAATAGFSKGVVNQVKIDHLKYFIVPFIIDFRINNSHSRVEKDYRRGFESIVKRYGWTPSVIFRVLPAMFAPRFFWVFVRQVIRFTRRIRSLFLKI
jgi:hypothetical protein